MAALKQKKIDQIIEICRPMIRRLDQENREHKHVSVILRRNRVVSIGMNVRKTHPLAQKIGYLNSEQHSEFNALIQIPKPDRIGLTLVNFRFNNQGDLRMSRPCELCLPWCVDAFDSIYYSTNEGVYRL